MGLLERTSCRRIAVHWLLKRLISFPSICALVSAMAFSLLDPQGAPLHSPLVIVSLGGGPFALAAIG
jgi:hypothetical protein